MDVWGKFQSICWEVSMTNVQIILRTVMTILFLIDHIILFKQINFYKNTFFFLSLKIEKLVLFSGDILTWMTIISIEEKNLRS